MDARVHACVRTIAYRMLLFIIHLSFSCAEFSWYSNTWNTTWRGCSTWWSIRSPRAKWSAWCCSSPRRWPICTSTMWYTATWSSRISCWIIRYAFCSWVTGHAFVTCVCERDITWSATFYFSKWQSHARVFLWITLLLWLCVVMHVLIKYYRVSSSSQILGWRACMAGRCKPTHPKWSHYGTAPPSCCLALSYTPLL